MKKYFYLVEYKRFGNTCKFPCKMLTTEKEAWKDCMETLEVCGIVPMKLELMEQNNAEFFEIKHGK